MKPTKKRLTLLVCACFALSALLLYVFELDHLDNPHHEDVGGLCPICMTLQAGKSLARAAIAAAATYSAARNRQIGMALAQPEEEFSTDTPVWNRVRMNT